MSIVGAGQKNLQKRLKVERLKKISDAARPDLSHSDDEVSGRANFILGSCFLEQGKISQAIEYLNTAVFKCSQNAQYLTSLAKTQLMQRDESRALHHADIAWENLTDEDAVTYNMLGYVYARLGNHDRALSLFEKAVELDPDSIEYRDNLARTYTYFGKKGDAISQFEAILNLNPGYGKAHLGLADIKTWTDENNHIERLENAVFQTPRKIENIRIRFALGKECEDLNRSAQAYDHYRKANSDFISNLKFDVKHDEALIDAFRQSYEKHLKGQISSVEDKALFVVGIPRTGTTLFDRILSAHSSVVSAGELQSMPLAVKQASKTSSKIVLDLESISKAGQATATEIGEAYLDNARLHQGACNGGVFTDKLPLNFMYAGFILTALPRARMVCLRRSPLDTVWSNYKHLFAGGARYHTYSYDLISIARFYLAYQRITDFWAQEFPDQFKIFHYEDIVRDQRAQSEQLLSHCGLNWEEGCLNFHASKKVVATPSANQVRQPIYTGSIDKWKRYEAQLQPVRDFFLENSVEV